MAEGTPTTELVSTREARLRIRRQQRRARKRARRCKKCGSAENLTRHHIIPRVFKSGDVQTICLCRSCHDRLEMHILSIESFHFHIPLGAVRKKMPDLNYYEALITFLGAQKSAELMRYHMNAERKKGKRRRPPKSNKKKRAKNILHFYPPTRHQQRPPQVARR